MYAAQGGSPDLKREDSRVSWLFCMSIPDITDIHPAKKQRLYIQTPLRWYQTCMWKIYTWNCCEWTTLCAV